MTTGSLADQKLAAARRSYHLYGADPRSLEVATEAALLFEQIGETARAQMALDLAAEIERGLIRRKNP